ncbi:hypothetical protein ACLOJK_006362 [Asimina triloba]
MGRHPAVVDGLAEPSQRLVEAALSRDAERVAECLSRGDVDVNYVGTVSLRAKCSETILWEEAADEVRIGYEEFRTDVTALFAAAHSGHLEVARKLLSAGADVNEKLFRGYATTAAASEGHCSLLDMLVKAGAWQLACEDALLEASLFGQARAAELLICSDMTRPDAAAHALVRASSRGFIDVVSTLIKAGAQTGYQFRLGAWSWDAICGEELRVGACLGEPYNEVWCAVEYSDASGQILRLLLQHESSFLEDQLHGRTLLCHAILCKSSSAVLALLDSGANPEFPLRTEKGHESRPLHLAARLGCLSILGQLIAHRCEIDARTEHGETALMISAKADHMDCFLELATAGADLGLTSSLGESAVQLAKRSEFGSSVMDILLKVITARSGFCSSNLDVFSPLHFAAGAGDVKILQMILRKSIAELNKQDGFGYTPIMAAAKGGHAEAFRYLAMAGADISLKARDGETVVSLLHSQVSFRRDKLENILLDAVLACAVTDCSTFGALHYAAQKGDLSALVQLMKMGFPTNSLDEDRYSPLMLAARGGHADACKLLLLQGGADCRLANMQGETALSIARRNTKSRVAEGVILDHLARSHVLSGEELSKHTRGGRGRPHMKTVRMLKTGLLTWGRSNRRNVMCTEAAAGPSISFQKNQKKKTGDGKAAIFRVVTTTGGEVHFEASCGAVLELWVRGINLIVKEAAVGADEWILQLHKESKKAEI